MTARVLVSSVVMLVVLAGFEASAGASVPGAKGRIAFSSTREANAELYSVWPDGSAVRRLTWTPATEQSPAWSPDLLATKIAYESDESGRFRVHVMDWDGRNQRRVSPEGSGSDEDVQPTWSPNAAQIAFASTRGGGWHIWAMNADGTNLRRVTDGPGVEPAWSPNGVSIAYAWQDSIWLSDADGRNPRRLTTPTGLQVSSPAWSPTGDEIVFSRFRPDGLPGELFVASAFFPGQERQLTSGGFANARPSWSPDSSEIVFQRLTPASGGWQLLAIRADGTATREVQPAGGGDLTPAWGSSLHLPSSIPPAAPTIQFFSPTDGQLFWQGQSAPALYVCTSATAAVVSCDGDVPLGAPLDTSTAGVRTFTVRAADHEGRTTRASVTYRVVDIIDPQIELRTPHAGAVYSLGEQITVDYACTDPGGAIAFCDGTLPAGATLPTGEIGTYTFTVFAVDEAHNVTDTVVTYRVADVTPPSITITTPADHATYTLGATVSSSFACQDDSGIVKCDGAATLATDTVGRRTFTVTAADRYGNTSIASVDYDVVFAFSGFFAPLASPAARFPAGEPIPVKFSLAGNHGLNVLAAGSPTWRPIPCGSPAGDGGKLPATGRLSYSPAADRYLYLLDTERAWTNSCRELTLTLHDGTSRTVIVGFKS